MARGLPPDSAMMIFLTPGARFCGRSRTCRACAIQLSSPPRATSASRPVGLLLVGLRDAGRDVGGLAQHGEVLVGGGEPVHATGASVPTAWVVGLCSIAAVLAESDPSAGASSATAVGAGTPRAGASSVDPVATAPTAAADAITVVRTRWARTAGESPR